MRRLTVLVAISLVAVCAVAILPEHATATSRAYALGDSVMLGAKTQLEKRRIRVDAVVSRQLRDGATILSAQRPLPGVIVVHLGSNGPITRAQFDGLMGTVKGKQVIVLTVKEPRSWEASVNRVLRAGARRWANATLLDWHWHATRHPEWLYDDGIHLRPTGAAAYAKLVGKAVNAARRTAELTS
jgi:hypothetical protein